MSCWKDPYTNRLQTINVNWNLDFDLHSHINTMNRNPIETSRSLVNFVYCVYIRKSRNQSRLQSLQSISFTCLKPSREALMTVKASMTSSNLDERRAVYPPLNMPPFSEYSQQAPAAAASKRHVILASLTSHLRQSGHKPHSHVYGTKMAQNMLFQLS